MPQLHFYLPEPMRQHAALGEVNIINRIANAVAPGGYTLAFHGEYDAAQGDRHDLHLLHMAEPEGPDMLNLRRAYHYPFWQIEATNERWNFDVAKAQFDPETVDTDAARPFFRRWRKKLLGDEATTSEGFVFIPLQGKLRQHRSFQTMSPAAMIEATLEADPDRRICATLHPKEQYDADDMAMLETISARFPRFQLLQSPAVPLLLACDYVVTQNSAVALEGFFAKKPAVLFAGIDFHHIAGSVQRDGLAAFEAATQPQPFIEYLFWFFRQNCINGGAPEAEAQILARMRRHGWPV